MLNTKLTLLAGSIITELCFYCGNLLYFENTPALALMLIFRKRYCFFSLKFMVAGDELQDTFRTDAVQSPSDYTAVL